MTPFGESYLSADMQSADSTAPDDGESCITTLLNKTNSFQKSTISSFSQISAKMFSYLLFETVLIDYFLFILSFHVF